MSGMVLGTMTFGDTVDADGAARMLDVALEAGVTGSTPPTATPAARPRRCSRAAARPPRPDRAGHQGRHAAPGRRRRTAAVCRRAAGRRSREACSASAWTASTSSTCTSRTGRRRSPRRWRRSPAVVEEGKVGALGVSNFAAWQIAELRRVADEAGAPRPVVAQQLHNLLARRIEEEYAEFAASTGLATMVYNPLGGGLLDRPAPASTQPSERALRRLPAGRDVPASATGTQELFDAVGRTAADRRGGRHRAPRAGAALAAVPADHRRRAARRLARRSCSPTSRPGRGPLPDHLVHACDEVGARLRGPMPGLQPLNTRD